MTVRELRRQLRAVPHEDAEVRVVFHGRSQPSFNQPVESVYVGGHLDFLVIVEEKR